MEAQMKRKAQELQEQQMKFKQQQDATNEQIAVLKAEKDAIAEQLAQLEKKEEEHTLSNSALREERKELRTREDEWHEQRSTMEASIGKLQSEYDLATSKLKSDISMQMGSVRVCQHVVLFRSGGSIVRIVYS